MFAERIIEYSEILNDTDHILIRYIIKNEHRIKDLTIREVSEENFVAYNTVVRFSKKLGYTGFSELKFSFTKTKKVKLSEDVDTEKNNEGIAIIQKTNEILNGCDLEEIALKIFAAKEVAVFGVGDSLYFASLLAKNFLKADKHIKVLDRLYEVDNFIRDGNNKSLLILVSAGGNTEEVCIRARRSISKSIEVVSITGNENSELATITSNNIVFSYTLDLFHDENLSDLRGMMQAIMVFSKFYQELFSK